MFCPKCGTVFEGGSLKCEKCGYYEIGVRFFDASGNVVDTDYTNGLDLEAGDSRQFEIMHKANVNYSQVSLYVKDVN